MPSGKDPWNNRNLDLPLFCFVLSGFVYSSCLCMNVLVCVFDVCVSLRKQLDSRRERFGSVRFQRESFGLRSESGLNSAFFLFNLDVT